MLAEIEVLDADELLGSFDPALGRRDGLVLLVELVIEVDLGGVFRLAEAI